MAKIFIIGWALNSDQCHVYPITSANRIPKEALFFSKIPDITYWQVPTNTRSTFMVSC